ncbi:hypothetical protein [Motilimonas pumila]|uniref:Tetratricopeptide repeat protein n=1 Tax=Motilimonas pumila TaxID=2303987 RepID=A0A418YC78_9GAMM|nr:hypothetical protein [Motilimonas pumila]RJG42128.1 hypothetical protein D1Z90_14380 [Motilimonas pumila]
MVVDEMKADEKVDSKFVTNTMTLSSSTAKKSNRLRWFARLKTTHLLLLIAVGNLVWVGADKHAFLDFWLSNDQHAYVEFKRGNYAKSAALFDDTTWKGYSRYLSGDFLGAIDQLSSHLSPKTSEQSKIQINEQKQPIDLTKLIVANSYAHTTQFEKATTLYNELLNSDALAEQARNNLAVVAAAIKKIEEAPPAKQDAEKVIDDRKLVDDEPEKETQKALFISDQIWLKQVRQDPSKFLRQKFQQEYSNEQK